MLHFNHKIWTEYDNMLSSYFLLNLNRIGYYAAKLFLIYLNTPTCYVMAGKRYGNQLFIISFNFVENWQVNVNIIKWLKLGQ